MFSWEIDETISLELLESRYTEELFQLTDENRDFLGRWLPWVDAVHEPDDTAKFINESQQQWKDNLGFQAAILFEGRLAGVIGHHNIDWTNQKTSLGYWLGKSYQGQGIITKCCRSIVTHAFEELNLHRVEIHCAADNDRSRAVPERLGFREEATLRQAARLNEQFVDLVVYAALSDSWESS